MPKGQRNHSSSFDGYRASPYPCSSSHASRSSPKRHSEADKNIKEWDEARCPVCMEHPHNAVLLICTSHEKGCRPYMCDTSYRHSNCLDQYRKSFAETVAPISLEESQLSTTNSLSALVESTSTAQQEEIVHSFVAAEETNVELHDERSEDSTLTMLCESKVQVKIVCPLCRGHVKEWIVVEPARSFMNAKTRNCACETCNFSGPYSDLRKHARVEHPLVRPSEEDPERRRTWRRLERQRDIGDLISTLQSVGEDRSEDSVLLSGDDGGWLTVFFLVRVLRPETGIRSSSWTGTSRARAQLRVRRRSTRLWGESYEGETRDEENESSDVESDRRRRRRYLWQRPSPNNQP